MCHYFLKVVRCDGIIRTLDAPMEAASENTPGKYDSMT